MTQVNQKVAVVTGAGKGMGAAVARRLHQDGYQLALMSNGGGAEALGAELDVLGMTGSVAVEGDLANLVAEAVDRYGRIDAVVNNTGHPATGDVLDLTDAEWRNGMDLVFLNVVRMARLVTPHLLAVGGGAVVNISTFAAFEPDSAFPISGAMRAALASYTKLYSDRYAAVGIRMNNVLPGFIESYEITEEVRRRIPMDRSGRVGEIADTVAFLLSDGGGYITGQNIRVDGGISRSV